jgi:hypothetical protein
MRVRKPTKLEQAAFPRQGQLSRLTVRPEVRDALAEAHGVGPCSQLSDSRDEPATYFAATYLAVLQLTPMFA